MDSIKDPTLIHVHIIILGIYVCKSGIIKNIVKFSLITYKILVGIAKII